MNTMEHLVLGIVGANNSDEHNWPPLKLDQLPGATSLPGAVTHNLPVSLVGGHLDIVAVRSVVTVPQQ